MKEFLFALVFVALCFIGGSPQDIQESGVLSVVHCDVFVYTSLEYSATPKIYEDDVDTCPEGGGRRAFVSMEHSGGLHNHAGVQTPRLREIRPLAGQEFRCLNGGRKCYIVVRGFGLREGDAMTVLPIGQTRCPPRWDLDGTDELRDMPTIVQSNSHASLARSSLSATERNTQNQSGGGFGASLTAFLTRMVEEQKPPEAFEHGPLIPPVSFAAFELPDRSLLETGRHTLCYAPYLTNRPGLVDELGPADFHYHAGTVTISKSLFECDFESPVTSDPDLGVPPDELLPCGFRNYRDRYQADLLWRLGEGETPVIGTGPDGDATSGLGGRGKYIYMASPGYALGAAATLVSAPIAFPQGGYCVEFSYNMNGEDVSTIRAYMHEVKLLGEPGRQSPGPGAFADIDVNLLGEWGAPKWVSVGNKGPSWHRGGFEFRTAKQPQVFQLVFEGLAGRSEYGDIALDDVKISPGRCSNEVRHHMPRTLGFGQQPLICGEVRMQTGSHATDKSWFVEGAVSCSGRGYSLDHSTSGTWLPCCVPHFGTYKLVLQDRFGDGWTGSTLEFRFYDRLFKFGDDDFASSGYDKTYDLTIGTIEITRIEKPAVATLRVFARIARANSYMWCGVAQAGKNGLPLKISLDPSLLKKYGVRSAEPTTANNQEVSLEITNQLKPNLEYDLYCHAEQVGDPATIARTDASVDAEQAEIELNRIKQEILASRLRVSTDRDPPKLSAIRVDPNFHQAVVHFSVDEPATIWCSALVVPEHSSEDALFGAGGPLAGLLRTHPPLTSEEELQVWRYFETAGSGVDVDVPRGRAATQTVEVGGLLPNQEYMVYCYAEDNASPTPNRLSTEEIRRHAVLIRTRVKVPTVKIVRKSTFAKGFKLYLKADAPGKASCAAAPSAYGTPSVEAVVEHGAVVRIPDPRKEVSVELHGVDENVAYVLYCVGIGMEDTDGASFLQQQYSGPVEMLENSITAISYGRYCEEPEGDEIYSIEKQKSVFHPISAVEEMRIRNFILKQTELGLEGVYRITLLPNKTEIYNYLGKKGPKPQRYARVRAGRCVDEIGFYEQFKVGPIDGKSVMRYERIAQPIETGCGGYNPQGVFGRRRRQRRLASEDAAAKNSSSTPNAQQTPEQVQSMENAVRLSYPGFTVSDLKDYNLSNWFRETFGFDFASDSCEAELADILNPSGNNTTATNRTHDNKQCLQFGPVILEEVCEDSHKTPTNVTDNASNTSDTPLLTNLGCASRSPRLWVGVRTPVGDSVPLYFLYNISDPHNVDNESGETLNDWAQRIISTRTLDLAFYELWFASGIFVDGQIYATIDDLLAAIKAEELTYLSPGQLARRRRLREQEHREYVARVKSDSLNEALRRLAPDPFGGAPGTAGPLPKRQQRRGGLEYRSHPEHVEAQGKRFSVVAGEDEEMYRVDYAGWQMTVMNDRDTSLRIYDVRFQGQRVAFEMGLMEALAHYTVSERNWFFMDSWYGGLGAAARRVHKGIECPKTGMSLFWDGSLCVFEQDLARPVRSHWKSGEIRDGSPQMVLVLRQMLTVSNYDYVTDYVFHLTGMAEGLVSFTGELYAGVEVPWYSSRQADYGVQVTGAMRFAALHAHLAVWKIDFDIGNYEENSVLLTEVVADPVRFGANKLGKKFAAGEREAAVLRNDSRALVYEIVDENLQIYGNYGGYRIVPGQGMNPLQHEYELYDGPGAWAKYKVFTTVFKYSELDATLPRDNKFPKKPAVSVDRYIADDESVRNADLVTWISSSVFHVPVIEDMPLTIPVGNTLGWLIKPANLFFEDPSMDLHNAMGGGVDDPGTCAVVRVDVRDVEPSLGDAWRRIGAPPP